MDVVIGVIGCGYWGKNLVRNFIEAEECWLQSICDTSEATLKKFGVRYPSLDRFTNYKDLIYSDKINTVVVATPVRYHYFLAKEALLAGKNVLVEKPLAASVKEAEELVELADKKGLVLMVDHTFLYTGSVRKIKELVDGGHIGNILYYDSVRVNLGLFQEDINVVWDLAPHDLSIMDYLLKEKPISVRAIGAAHVKKDIENIGYLTLNFASDLIAHFHFNWMSPVKIRLVLISGSEQMVVYDDLMPSEKVKVYATKVRVNNGEDESYKLHYDYRVGDMWAPKVDMSEALGRMCKDFALSIKEKRKPLSDADSGLRIVRILEAAQKSIKSNGEEVKL
ncbi:Oxidoreductase domain-containing protein [Candidatus Omnitrophus magneticus]|uniref:Oxidoreductase domain-containing protein n=1 Tax=Candidatus Omnitrophus magneticus TaxID=1609969 RepID=A0A0F0CQ13_9BACT|nr:oxidoreductase domain-containing protein [Candidatus Omnitrophus magneticus]KJJ85724.1 Oxidoreductase domain-containing protein [Candidatus Omnitrophus magneticus]